MNSLMELSIFLLNLLHSLVQKRAGTLDLHSAVFPDDDLHEPGSVDCFECIRIL